MPALVKRPINNRDLAMKFKRYTRDYNWVQDNRDRLKEKYNNKYIAVKNFKVHYTADTMPEMVRKILESGDEVGDFIIEFITDKPLSLIL